MSVGSLIAAALPAQAQADVVQAAQGAPGPAGATAAAVQPDVKGACHNGVDGFGFIHFLDNGFGGWCEGTGPTSYRAWLICSRPGGFEYRAMGAWAWYGDRRGSWAQCDLGWTGSFGPPNAGFQSG
jgi:hypothetical protein